MAKKRRSRQRRRAQRAAAPPAHGKSRTPSPAQSSPVTADGVLDWTRVHLPPLQEQEGPLRPATMADQPMPFVAGVLAVTAFLGAIFTARWSPLLLSLLAAASLLHPEARASTLIVRRAALGSLLALACWPLISNLRQLDRVPLDVLGAGTMLLFCLALWLVGDVLRRTSLLYGEFSQSRLRMSLYSVGIGCQALCLTVAVMGSVMLLMIRGSL